MSTVDIIKQRGALLMRSKAAPIVQTFGMTLEYNEQNESVWTLPFNESSCGLGIFSERSEMQPVTERTGNTESSETLCSVGGI